MNDSTDEEKIRETIERYSDGMRTANAARLKEAFHKQAILCGYLDDHAMAAQIDALFDWVDSHPAPEDYSCVIAELKITNRVATATVREMDQHGDFIDHFHLLKDDGRWWIVSKIWDNAND